MDFLTTGSFLFFTGLVAFVTWRLTRSHGDSASVDGYFLAGRALTGGYIAGSLMLTNLSTEQLIGLNGAAYANGICVMAWEVIAAMSLVAMALYFLPRYLRSGIATIPEFLEQRFDAGTRMITTVIFVLAYAAILLPMILYTGAVALVDVLDLSELMGLERSFLISVSVWFIGIVGSIYAIFGGLRSVAISDTLNGFGLLVGGVMIAWLGLGLIGDGEGALAGFAKLREAQPEKFNSLGAADSDVPFSTLFTGVLLLNLFYWTTNQQIIQRTFGASSLAEGQKGVLYAGVLKVLAPLILVLPGVIAFHLYHDPLLKNDEAYGTLVHNVLPKPLVGFFAAVLVGAILSSFNSALNSTATLFSLGIIKPLAKAADDQRLIRAGKSFGALVAVIAMIVAPMLQGQTSIFQYLQTMNALYFIPIFSVVIVGLVFRRVPAIAAKLALVIGLGAIALGYFGLGIGSKDPMIPIHTFHFLGVVFAGLVLMMVIIGKVQPRRDPWVQRATPVVDMTPWRGAKPLGFGLIVVVLLIYLAFADTSVL